MKKPFLIFCLNLILFLPGTVCAQEPKFISVHKDWYVFTIKQKSTDVCYLTSKAAKSAEKELGVINFRTGYSFKKGMDAVITIDNDKFLLFTQGSDGWAKDSKTDKAIVKAMIRGTQMLIAGISSRGTKTTDTFSLSGFTAAYKAASKACKVK